MSRPAKLLALVLASAAGGFLLGRLTAPKLGPAPPPDLERVTLRERVLELEAHRDRLERGLLEAQRQLDGTATSTGGMDRAAFVSPEIGGLSIDACLEQKCGQAAADFFCRANGFARAADFAIVQGAFRTVSLVEGAVACEPEEELCRAFDLIVCERARP